jgi:hypothetical protein
MFAALALSAALAAAPAASPAPTAAPSLSKEDADGGAATVKLVAAEWIDYLHLTKYEGEWKIINVLWEWKK